MRQIALALCATFLFSGLASAGIPGSILSIGIVENTTGVDVNDLHVSLTGPVAQAADAGGNAYTNVQSFDFSFPTLAPDHSLSPAFFTGNPLGSLRDTPVMSSYYWTSDGTQVGSNIETVLPIFTLDASNSRYDVSFRNPTSDVVNLFYDYSPIFFGGTPQFTDIPANSDTATLFSVPVHFRTLFLTYGSEMVNDTSEYGTVLFATATPEPASVVLCGGGMLALLVVARRRRARS